MKIESRCYRRGLSATVGAVLVAGAAALTAPHALGESPPPPIQDSRKATAAADPATTQSPLLGDFNLNGHIDIEDVTACALAWRERNAYYEAYPGVDEQTLNTVGDFTGDGLFDTQDIEPYKTFVIAELSAQQESLTHAQHEAEEAEEAEELTPVSTVVWTNNTLDDALSEGIETQEALPDTEGADETEALEALLDTGFIVDPAFSSLPPARSARSEDAGGQVISGSRNSGGGGGGGGGSLGGGGGGGGGSSGGGGGGGSSGGGSSSGSASSSGSGSGRVSVVGGGTSGIIVAGGGSSSSSSSGSYSSGTTGGQGKVELRNPDAAVAPIEHEPNYRGEAALFGYAPFYDPNPVAFDLDNKPYIRVAGNVQTQGPNGEWVDLSINDSIERYYQSQRINRSFIIMGGSFIDQRITFDSRGDAYTIARVASGDNRWWFLLHSRDKCGSWDVYPLPVADHVRVEFNDGHNTLTTPPVILLIKDQYLGMILPTRKNDGNLAVPEAISVSNDSLLVANHSGGSNSAITAGGQVFVVYPLASAYQQYEGTSQFVMAFDRATGNVTTQQTFLGNVGDGAPDPHYLPSITVDSQGHLHAVLGAHHDNLFYLKSLSPLDASGWSNPVVIGKTVAPSLGAHTYPSLLCDQDDRLHVVTRWAGDYGYKFKLAYNVGNANSGTWQEQKNLVSPFRPYYSIWYQHLSIDREGRLFLNYLYYGNQLNAEQIAAYRQIWPEDGVPSTARPYPEQQIITQIKAHDPAMLFTDNAGEDWRLVTSPDLFEGE